RRQHPEPRARRRLRGRAGARRGGRLARDRGGPAQGVRAARARQRDHRQDGAVSATRSGAGHQEHAEKERLMKRLMKQGIVVSIGLVLGACAASGAKEEHVGAASAGAARGAKGGAHQAPHAFSVEDMLAMDRISDPQVSPDGKRVLFNVRVTDLAANKGRTDLWTIGIDGSGLARLTDHEATDTNGRWLGDGSVVFLSSRGGSMQVWQVASGGGEAKQLTELPLDVTNMSVFPDGKRLLLAMDVYADAATLEETARRDAEVEKNPVKARVYDSLLFRHWDTWED